MKVTDGEGGMTKDRVDQLHHVVTIVSASAVVNCTRITDVSITPQRLKFTIAPLMFESDEAFAKVEDLWDAIEAVLDAVTGLHECGIFHNDIRWPNVMFDPVATWKLVDFDHASVGPGSLAHWARLNPQIHDAFDGASSAMSDLYAVGCLVDKLPSQRFETPPALAAFATSLKEKTHGNAKVAVAALRKAREADKAMGCD